MKKYFHTGILLPVLAGLFACKISKTPVASSAKKTPAVDSPKTDTTKKAANKPQPYDKVITAKAITKKGLFTVHKVDDRYFFEIPMQLFNKDMQVVSSINKAAVGGRVMGMFGYAGDYIATNIIRFAPGLNNKLFMNVVNFDLRAADSSENGLFRSVLNSTMQPIMTAFDIKALSTDSSAYVIDVTDYLNSDSEVISFSIALKQLFNVKGPLQADRSFIQNINAYPANIEIQTVKTFGPGEQARSYVLNNSIFLLPEQPMQPRYFDERVGYFMEGFMNFDKNPQGIAYTTMITRWRLEPKDEDVEKYKRGELVEPKKPIVFYIDPETPKKWMPYLIEGVNDWQKAFEKAGFKNAIYAIEAPANDSTWSIEDARNSVIVYKPSYALNASGPHLHDQRTGEILQARINWYHNVMQLVHDWYMIQVGPNDPRARHMQLEDSLMGKLIRFVSSHEIGHTLGLRHNFGASSCVPVEKLRDKKWVEENGFCPSIMDYARFNYVAQPEDNISEKGLMPRIGVYDEWAIEWGYKWLPHLKTEKESVEYMAKWATKRIAKDKRLWYGNEGVKSDARCQSEDIGDDAVKAGEYGIKNLKRVVAGLKEWTYQPAEDYTALRSLFRQTHEQFKRYLFHAANWIGATNVTPRKNDEEGVIFTFPSKQKQKEVVIFLHQQLFETPEWLINRELFTLAGMGTGYDIGAMQRDILQKLLSNGLLGQFEFSRMANPGDAYSTGELLTDLEAGIFKEIKQKKPIDEYRRTLQRIYVMQLLKVLDPNMEGVVDLSFRDFSILPWARRMDLHAIVKGHLKELVQMIDAAAPSYKDKLSKYHFADIKDKIKQALNIDKSEKDKSQQNAQALKPVSIDYMEWIREQSLYSNWKGCTLMTNE